jgi:parallel beta-helix repeat protein
MKIKPFPILTVLSILVQTCYANANTHSIKTHFNFLNSDTVTIDVKSTGAVGNGTQDDYAAITKALNQTTGPSKIHFTAGSYLISQALATNHDGTIFVFDKNAKLIIQDNADGGIILRNNNCQVMGGFFQGSGQSSKDLRKGYGVMLTGVSNCKVLNSTFDKISGVSIFLINRGSAGCDQCLVKGNFIREPAFSRTIVQDAAGIMVGYSGTGYFHTNNVIANNSVDGNETIAHGIAMITHGKGNTVTGNTVKNCLRYGIVLYESSNVAGTLTNNTVSYNTVQNIGTPAGVPPSPYGMGIYLMTSSYSTVKGNKVTHCLVNTNNSETLPSGAIALNGSTHCTVDSNIITDSHRYGIACSMAYNSSITNNVIDGVGESGIYLINTAFNVVKMNTIKNVTVYGIKGLFGNTSRPNYAAQIKNGFTEYQNLSTGQGIEISENKIDGSKVKTIRFTGEDPDPKTNYSGNKLNKISIHNNTITGASDPKNSISLDKADENGGNKVSNNKYQ